MSEYSTKEEKMDRLRTAQVCLAGAAEALAKAGFGSLAYLEVTPVKNTVEEIVEFMEGEE